MHYCMFPDFPASGGPGYYGGPGGYGGSPRSLQRLSSPPRGGEYGGVQASPLSPSQCSHTSITSMDTVFSANDPSLFMARGPALLG